MHILNEPFQDLLSEEETESLLTDFYMSSFVRWQTDPVTFRSGLTSHVLVGGREDLTEHPFVLKKIGKLIAKAALQIAPTPSHMCLIGNPIVGNTLATAASVVSGHIPFMVMRQVKKNHGAHKSWVDGSPYDYDHFVTIDNTITDGGSKFDMIERLVKDGFRIGKKEMSHLILVDRGIGAIDKLRSLGHHAYALMDLPTIVTAFVERESSWSKDKLKTLLEENSRNRLDP